MISRLAHYSVRAKDLDASTAFYTEVIGRRVGPRPPFGFPGVWLYLAQDEAAAEQGCVHLIGDGDQAARDRYLGGRPGLKSAGTGALDHIAFLADDWPTGRRRLRAAGVSFTERLAPGLDMRQVFITDPDGLVVELNYPEVAGGARDQKAA
jgi:catechol 2,3-dioxygenase-like lactoylglutathione lyase family enzyme